MGEIARRAGVTRATVYRHYPDRDLLVAAVLGDIATVLVPPLLKEMRHLAWADALNRLARRAISVAAAHRVHITTVAPHLESMTRSAIAGEPIEAQLGARRASGDITVSLDDAWLALCIRSLCLTAVRRLADPETDPERLADELSLSLRRLCV